MAQEKRMHFPKIRHAEIRSKLTVSQLLAELRGCTMGAGRIARAADIAEEMIKDRECTVFLGLAGAMVPGGMRSIIVGMLKQGWVDVLVTTGATLTHDLAESLGHTHLLGSEHADDAKLRAHGYDRMFDSLMPNEAYEDIEELVGKNFGKLKNCRTIREFLSALGSCVPKGDSSILRTCYEKNIPIFCPAISDSGLGLVVWGQLAQGKSVNAGGFDDLKEMLDIAWRCKKAGVIYIGGGVPKNHIQQAMQIAPNAASYGVQITMDRPEHGGSSGAELREGISWGKMNPKGHFVDVICDATIALPLLYGALVDRIKKRG